MSDPQKLKVYEDPILDRQIEELIASVKTANEELGLSVAEPSSISNLTATGGWGIIGLEYAYNNYNGHLYSEIWRSDDSTFANGARVGATAAKFYNDSIYGAGLSDVYYYWVRNVNIDGDASDWYGPVSGSISSTSSFNVDDLIGQLGFTHFQAGTYPIRSEATLPDLSTTPANYPVGSLIYLTTNGKLYRNVNWVWTAEIDAGDIEGLLTNDQIDTINAAKITSQITQTQITDGAISTAKLDAGAVTTAKVAAGAITADELAANSVTANAIKAGEITAGKLSANAVIAGNIAAGALVVDDGVMNNGYIKTALIDDGAVTNLKIGNVIESTDGVTWSIDKNGGIDCRELIIRNSDGSVLLQSGQTLDFADVGGTTKPADNADNTQTAIEGTTDVATGGLKMTDSVTGNYALMTPGDLEFYSSNELHKAVRKIEFGYPATTGSAVTFNNAFNSPPKVIVSPYEAQFYDVGQNQYDQSFILYPDEVTETGFTPKAQLVRDGVGLYPGSGIALGGTDLSFSAMQALVGETATTSYIGRTDITSLKINWSCGFTMDEYLNDSWNPGHVGDITFTIQYQRGTASWSSISGYTSKVLNNTTQSSSVSVNIAAGADVRARITINALNPDSGRDTQDYNVSATITSLEATTIGQTVLGSSDVYWLAIGD